MNKNSLNMFVLASNIFDSDFIRLATAIFFFTLLGFFNNTNEGKIPYKFNCSFKLFDVSISTCCFTNSECVSCIRCTTNAKYSVLEPSSFSRFLLPFHSLLQIAWACKLPYSELNLHRRYSVVCMKFVLLPILSQISHCHNNNKLCQIACIQQYNRSE